MDSFKARMPSLIEARGQTPSLSERKPMEKVLQSYNLLSDIHDDFQLKMGPWLDQYHDLIISMSSCSISSIISY